MFVENNKRRKRERERCKTDRVCSNLFLLKATKKSQFSKSLPCWNWPSNPGLRSLHWPLGSRSMTAMAKNSWSHNWLVLGTTIEKDILAMRFVKVWFTCFFGAAMFLLDCTSCNDNEITKKKIWNTCFDLLFTFVCFLRKWCPLAKKVAFFFNTFSTSESWRKPGRSIHWN